MIMIHVCVCVSVLGGTQLNGVMVIVVGNRHGDPSSNPRRGYLHFTWKSKHPANITKLFKPE